MGISAGADVVEDGLVFCVDAANKRSYPGTGTTWTDLVGGNNGTLTNGPTFNSDNGGSIEFDGTDDYILLDNDIILGTASSITVWVRDLGHTGIIAGSSNSNYLLATLQIGIHTYIFSNPPDPDFYYRWNTIVADLSNTWTHLSFSRDGLIAYFYINGGEAILMSVTGDGDDGYIVSSIGAGGSSVPMEGNLTCLHIYNRTLTDDEVRQNYNATRGRFK